jgi:hypothetical protein
LNTLAKVLIMLVRLIWIVELAVGISIASAKGLPYLKLHIGLGFAMALCLFVLSMIAVVKRAVVPAVIGVIFAVLLPYIGLQQFPIKFGPALGAIQYAHVVIAIVTIGVAEMLHGKIRRLSHAR